MEIVFVRHGESVANAEGRLQGQRDYPLTRRGRSQALSMARFAQHLRLTFDACYCSPLSRARETASIIAAECGLETPIEHADLMEFDVGELGGLLYSQLRERHPEFFERSALEYADYARWAGESYDALQARARRVQQFLQDAHRSSKHRVLVVGHGGFGKELMKQVLCEPVPHVLGLKFGNCTAMLVQMAERFGTYSGQLVWHVPVELMRA